MEQKSKKIAGDEHNHPRQPADPAMMGAGAGVTDRTGPPTVRAGGCSDEVMADKQREDEKGDRGQKRDLPCMSRPARAFAD
jgi:hypothetical protein